MIEIADVTKTYNPGVTALREVSLCVKQGEFAVLLGPSGAGKSTLLRCINGLVEPSAGTVRVAGIAVAGSRTQRRALRRRIGMVFQGFNLIRSLPVLNNVLVGRLGHKPLSHAWLFTRAEREMALEALARVGLADKLWARAGTLSGGQQQRVGIARALVQRPDLILADEPVASLDPATSHSVLRYVEEMNKNDGITVLCSLHFLSLARRFGTRIIALKAGEFVFDGLPAEIDEHRFKEIYGEEAVEVEIT
jgi:phosphonate transport system ATP-binding protein